MSIFCPRTLASGIDVGQGINVEPGKLDKNNKHRALNKREQNVQSYVEKTHHT